jgi:hypothetical protein
MSDEQWPGGEAIWSAAARPVELPHSKRKKPQTRKQCGSALLRAFVTGGESTPTTLAIRLRASIPYVLRSARASWVQSLQGRGTPTCTCLSQGGSTGCERSLWRVSGCAYSKQRPVDLTGLCAGPFTHRHVNEKLGSSAGILLCSIWSANARSARASTLAMASFLVVPYAMAPGRFGISAIQRPSTSRSVSMRNFMVSILSRLVRAFSL